ncbi:QueT transporter family protein [Mycoplasmatota bacterium]|nr:QueT transporter family protein [Mycoplasmatota bacterium]
MNNLALKDLIFQALIGASYVVITIIFYGYSYGEIQFRISEALLILIFFNKKNAVGLIIGTFIANFVGDIGIIDAIFGTIATSIAIYLMLLLKKMKPLALLIPVIINGLYVGLLLQVLYDLPLWLTVGQVSLGEAAVLYIIGLPLYYALNRNKSFTALFE